MTTQTTQKKTNQKASKGMEHTVYNQHGKEAGSITLNAAIFDVAWNGDLVHQVVTAMQANRRTTVAHAKDRSEVSGGGRKPWRQKGTGRARHGSRRSPIWVGGGVTHGPNKNKDYSQKTTKSMRTGALFAALSAKVRDNEVLLLDALTYSAPKTADAKATLGELATIKGYEGLATKKHNTALVLVTEPNEVVTQSFNNMGNVEVEEVRNVNAEDVLTYKYVIIVNPAEAQQTLEAKLK